jgi:hypothetical protein
MILLFALAIAEQIHCLQLANVIILSIANVTKLISEFAFEPLLLKKCKIVLKMKLENTYFHSFGGFFLFKLKL